MGPFFLVLGVAFVGPFAAWFVLWAADRLIHRRVHRRTSMDGGGEHTDGRWYCNHCKKSGDITSFAEPTDLLTHEIEVHSVHLR